MAEYTPFKPLHTHIPRGFDDYEPMYVLEENKRIEFNLKRNLRSQLDAITVSRLYFPDELIEEIAKHSNAYGNKKLGNLHKQIREDDILYFIAIYFFMGIVQLPSKTDYWRTPDEFWQPQTVCQKMSRNRFNYVFRYIHLSAADDETVEEDVAIEEEEQDDDDNEKIVEEEEEEMIDEDDEAADLPEWLSKVKLLVNHTNSVSKLHCKHPGVYLSIDEMMKLFKGRSLMTHRMRNKPIKEGYKFFAICDVETGYVWHFIPKGRTHPTTIQQNVRDLIHSLPISDEYCNAVYADFVVGMDNYFTYPNIVADMRMNGVGVVGTARSRKQWPPKELSSINDIRFNTLYTCCDDNNFLIARWVDNKIVTMVTTVHAGNESIERVRKKPRVNQDNRHHVETVWGRDSKKAIEIPCIIDDYNHWMLGVDKADQLISYYRPSIRCQRNWMPIMFHCFDILRINSYIMLSKHRKITHKEYVQELVKALVARAGVWQYTGVSTRKQHRSRSRASPSSLPATPDRKKRRVDCNNPSLPPLVDPEANHIKTVHESKTSRCCVYCSYLRAKQKHDGTPEDQLIKIRRIRRWCPICKEYICKVHWNDYHNRS